MGKSDRFTPMEIDYVRAVYSQIGPTEVAKRLGRSKRAVINRAKSMGLTESGCSKDKQEQVQTPEPNDRLRRLIEARETLRQALMGAPPAAVAGICREYRAVLDEIDRMEGSNAAEPSAFDLIAQSIAKGMQA